MKTARVAVVMPMYNAQSTLARCLEAIQKAQPAVDELIVVDDGSTDDSPEIATRMGARVIRTGDKPLGPAAARNLAVEHVTAEFIAFVDSDVEVRPTTIDRLVAPLRVDASLGATFGSYDDDPSHPSIPSRYANLRHHYVHQNAKREAGTFWAGCGAVRTSDYRAVGGFSAAYARPSIEDIEMGIRLANAGRSIQVVPDAQAKHLKAWTLKQLWRTDIWSRAVPWSRLLVASKELPDTLNTSRAEQMSAVCVHAFWFFLLLGLVIEPLLAAVSLLAFLLWLLLNRRFLSLLAKRGGLPLLVGGGLLHACYYGYASVTYALIALNERTRRRNVTSASDK